MCAGTALIKGELETSVYVLELRKPGASIAAPMSGVQFPNFELGVFFGSEIHFFLINW